jgi:hypothetical protein
MLWLMTFSRQSILMAITLCLLSSSAIQGQNLTGYWQGALPGAKPFRTVMQVNSSDNGKRKVTLFSIDQNGEPWSADSVTINGRNFNLILDSGRATYDGVISANSRVIEGTWNERNLPPRPLTFTRTEKQTSWNLIQPDKDDLLIVHQAKEILNSPAKWNRVDTDAHECAPATATFTLYCAIETATTKVSGSFKHRDTAMQEARFLIESDFEKGKHYQHRLLDYNNDPTTSFADIQKFFDLLKIRIERQIKDDHAAEKAK